MSGFERFYETHLMIQPYEVGWTPRQKCLVAGLAIVAVFSLTVLLIGWIWSIYFVSTHTGNGWLGFAWFLCLPLYIAYRLIRFGLGREEEES